VIPAASDPVFPVRQKAAPAILHLPKVGKGVDDIKHVALALEVSGSCFSNVLSVKGVPLASCDYLQ